MSQKSGPHGTAEANVREPRLQTRKQYSAEEKIRTVLEGLRDEYSIAELCLREGNAERLYYKRSKGFLEAGEKRLSGDTALLAGVKCQDVSPMCIMTETLICQTIADVSARISTTA